MNRATRQKLILIRDYLGHRMDNLCRSRARADAAFLSDEINRIQDALAGNPPLGFTLPPSFERDLEIDDGRSPPTLASIEQRIVDLESVTQQQGQEIAAIRKDCPPVVAAPVQQLTDHQAAMLRAASDHLATAKPVPGWPMVIKAHTGDNGFFDSMRRNHPVKLDEIVNGKRVVATHWFHCPDEGDQPVYRLEGEEGYRLASDIAGRITRPSHPAPITPLATAESITQAPTDGGK